MSATSVSSRREPLQDAAPDLVVHDLAAAEDDGRLHLVAFQQEALGVALLELEVVLVDLAAGTSLP